MSSTDRSFRAGSSTTCSPSSPLPDGMAPGLEATHYFQAPRATFASGAHVAVVEVGLLGRYDATKNFVVRAAYSRQDGEVKRFRPEPQGGRLPTGTLVTRLVDTPPNTISAASRSSPTARADGGRPRAA